MGPSSGESGHGNLLYFAKISNFVCALVLCMTYYGQSKARVLGAIVGTGGKT